MNTKKPSAKKQPTKKLVEKKQSKIASVNLKEFSKDADLLFKKYNLKTGIIVSNILDNGEKHLLSCVNSPDKKEEEDLLLATQDLFQLVKLNSESFSLLANILNTVRLKLEKQKIKKSKK